MNEVWADGARYEGNWKAGKAHGVGTFKHVTGDVRAHRVGN